MNIKKISAAVMAAAVLAISAPITGVLPDPLSVAASAAEYKAGDFFGVAMNPETGETFGEATDPLWYQADGRERRVRRQHLHFSVLLRVFAETLPERK